MSSNLKTYVPIPFPKQNIQPAQHRFHNLLHTHLQNLKIQKNSIPTLSIVSWLH